MKGLDEIIAMFQGLLSLYYLIKWHHLIQVSFFLNIPFPFKNFFIRYSCVTMLLVFTVQQSKLAICMHISLFFDFLPI